MMVAVPEETHVARPLDEIVATAVLPDDQVAVEVIVCVGWGPPTSGS